MKFAFVFFLFIALAFALPGTTPSSKKTPSSKPSPPPPSPASNSGDSVIFNTLQSIIQTIKSQANVNSIAQAQQHNFKLSTSILKQIAGLAGAAGGSLPSVGKASQADVYVSLEAAEKIIESPSTKSFSKLRFKAGDRSNFEINLAVSSDY